MFIIIIIGFIFYHIKWSTCQMELTSCLGIKTEICTIITANRIYKIYVSFDRRMQIISIFSHHLPSWMSMLDDAIFHYCRDSIWHFRDALVFFVSSKCVLNGNLYLRRNLLAPPWIIIYYHNLFRLSFEIRI